jgi:hypothetical protein
MRSNRSNPLEPLERKARRKVSAARENDVNFPVTCRTRRCERGFHLT